MKTKQLFLILLIIAPNIVFATTWADEYPIYVYGDVSFIAQMYEFVKKFIENDAIETIITLGISITFFIAGLKLKDGDLQGFGMSAIAPLTILALFFTPSVSVHVVDVRVDKGYIDHTLSPDGGYQKIDNVPWAIAFFPASAMLLTNLTIDIIDESWTSTHIANQFSATGFQSVHFAIKKAMAITSLDGSSDPEWAKYQYNIKTYIEECVTNRGLTYSKNSSFVFSNNLHYPEMLNPASYPTDFGNEEVEYIDYNETTYSNVKCSTMYTNLIANDAAKVLAIVKAKVDQENPTKKLTGSTGADDAYKQLTGDNIKATSSLVYGATTSLMNRFIEKQHSLDSVGNDGQSIATELTVQKSLVDMRAEGPAKLEWLAEVLPDVIFMVIGIFIAAYPILIVVQSFLGSGAYKNIANYFMGFFAFYFNLVGLALVQNIISFYTEQKANASIINSSGLQYSINNQLEFMYQQADMAGIAGIVGAISILAVTPLIFYGESKGFSAALNGVGGMFKGNIAGTSQDILKQGALEAEIDRQLLEERNGMTEAQASNWLSQNSYGGIRRDNMTARETYNQIMQGYNAMGSGLTAEDLMHSGNVPAYSQGAYLQSTQQMMKQVGTGRAIDSVSDAGHVAMQDGEVMSESINASHELRKNGYITQNIGGGMSMQQYAKDIGTDYIGSQGLGATGNLIASAVNQSVQQLASGKGLIDSGAFDNSGHLANNSIASNLAKAYEAQSLGSTMLNIGFGSKIDMSAMKSKSFEDGQVQGQTVNDVAEMRKRGYEVDDIAKGTAASSYAKDMGMDQIAKEMAKTKEKGQPDTLSSLIAGSRDQSLKQIAGGEGLIRGEGFDKDGNFTNGNLYKGYVGNTIKATANTIGFGEKAKYDDIKEVSRGDGQIQGQAISEIDDLRDNSQVKNRKGKMVAWKVDDIARGQALDSVGKEFGAIAKDNAVSSKEEDKFMQGNFTSGRVDANKTMGIGRHYTEGDMALVQSGSHMQLIGSVASTDGQLTGLKDSQNAVTNANRIDMKNQKLNAAINKLQDKIDNGESDNVTRDQAKIESWKSKIQSTPDAGTNAGMSFYDVTKTNSQAQMTASIGQAQGNKELLADGGGIIAQNAQYGTLSQAYSTDAKIQAQGGISKTIATDVSDAQMKAASQQGAVLGQMQEYAQKAGMSADAAKQFSNEIINGAKAGSELISQGITNAAKDVALAMSAGKTGSDIKNIDQAGGGDDYIQRSKTMSTIKSQDDNLNVQAMEGSKLVDPDGNITELGTKAMAIPHIEKANAMVGKQKVGENSKSIVEQTREAAYKEGLIRFGKNEEKANAYADEVVAPYYSNGDVKNGEVLSGNEFWAKQAELKAGVFTGSNSMAFGSAHQFSGVMSQDGMISGDLKGGLSTNYDKSSNYTEGVKINANLGNAETVAGQQAREATEHLFDPKKLAGMIVGKSFDEVSKGIQNTLGVSQETADAMATGTMMTGAAMTVAGATELSQRAYNYAKGNYVAKNGFSYQKGTTYDENGKEKAVYQDIKPGDSVNIKSNEGLKNYFESNKEDFKLESGTPGKIMGRLLEKGENDSLFKSSSNVSDSSSSESKNVSTSTQDSDTQSKQTSVNDNSTHSKTPVFNSKEDYTSIQENFQEKNANLKEKMADYREKIEDANIAKQKIDAEVYQNKTLIDYLSGQGKDTQNLEAKNDYLEAKANKYQADINSYSHELAKTSKEFNMNSQQMRQNTVSWKAQEIAGINNQSSGSDAHARPVEVKPVPVNENIPIGHVDYGKPAVSEVHAPSSKEGSGFGFKGAGLFGGLAVMGDQIARGNFGGAIKELYSETVTQSVNDYNRVGGGFSGVATAFVNQAEDMLMGQQARERLRNSNLSGVHALSYAAAATIEQIGSGASYVASIGAGAMGAITGNEYANSADKTMAYLNSKGWDATGALEKDYSRQGLNVNWGGGSSMASINPHSGAITPNYMHQGANNPFATNTSQIISNSNEDMRSSLMDLNYSNEETAEKFDKLMEYIRNGEGR